MNETEVMLRGCLRCCLARVATSKGTFPYCHPAKTPRGASPEAPLSAKVPAANSAFLNSRKRLTTNHLWMRRLCHPPQLPGTILGSPSSSDAALSEGCFATSFHAAHRTDPAF